MINDISNWGASAVTIHGRSRQQRYSKLPDWEYVYGCARKAPDALQVIGNGDVYSYVDWNKHKTECPKLNTLMIARGALVKVCNCSLSQGKLKYISGVFVILPITLKRESFSIVFMIAALDFY